MEAVRLSWRYETYNILQLNLPMAVIRRRLMRPFAVFAAIIHDLIAAIYVRVKMGHKIIA